MASHEPARLDSSPALKEPRRPAATLASSMTTLSTDLGRLTESLEAELPASMTTEGIPGLAIGICDAERTLWAAGFGTTRRGGEIPITATTRFSVQSTSKLVTATVALLAVQSGVLTLDAPITEAIPDLELNSTFEAAPERLITLRHCLSHTAGLTHEALDGSNYDLGSGDFTAHCRSISGSWLRFPVGHHCEYSNLGIDLAGDAIQRAGGEPFARYAHRALFAPLGMERSTFDAAEVITDATRALGHWRTFERAGRDLPVAVPMVAAGGLYTCVDDALRFLRLHLNAGESLLEPELVEAQLSVPFAPARQPLGYGLGVYIDEWTPGVRVLHHGGSGFGFQCQLFWVPSLGIGTAILTNSFDTDFHNGLARRIVAELADARPTTEAPEPPSGPEAQPSAAAAEELLGEYVGRLDAAAVRVERAGENLSVTAGTARPARLLAPRLIGLCDGERERFEFRPGADENEVPRYMTTTRDGTTRYRNDARLTPACELAPGEAGTYGVHVWGVPAGGYRLEQRGDSPVIVTLADAYADAGPVASDALALRLIRIEHGLYISSTGEVLDFRGDRPTYANVVLTRSAT